MLKTIPVKCAGCGGNLDITPEMENFSCGYCGTAQVVQRSGGTISLKVVGDAIKRVQVGTDKTAAELAIKRLSAELKEVERKIAENSAQLKFRLSENNTIFLICWFIGLLFCIGIGFAVESYGGIVFAILFVVVSAACLYFATERGREIKKGFLGKDAALREQGKEIHSKISKNKQLVD